MGLPRARQSRDEGRKVRTLSANKAEMVMGNTHPRLGNELGRDSATETILVAKQLSSLRDER